MAQIFPTKSNLLNAKRSLTLAQQGYELMDKKKNILLKNMFGLIDEVKELQQQIGQAYKEAVEALAKVNQTLGDCMRFALASPIDDSVRIKNISVMGVEIPKIEADERQIDIASFGFGSTSAEFDEVCLKFSKVRTLSIKLAEIESSVYALANALSITQKRSNALSNVTIPNLQETIRYISSELDEKEREEFSKLKIIKGKRN